MNQRNLEKKVLSWFASRHYLSERARPGATVVKGKFISNNWDFFSCFDGISVLPQADNNARVVFWQACSGTTYEAHRRKIEGLFPFTISPVQQIWYFYKRNAKWHCTVSERGYMGWKPVFTIEPDEFSKINKMIKS